MTIIIHGQSARAGIVYRCCCGLWRYTRLAAAKRGILVKGGNYIESLAETDTVVLDKTGTLTVGIPQISFVKTAHEVKEKEVILLAASAEQHSVHPLAVAIQKYVKEKGWQTPHHKSTKTIVARGMEAVVPAFADSKGGLSALAAASS